ncbi:hypothetical protein BGZ63DRAFT_230523 [Mariannaea sp. PMI_226]|nr:hypothetical protein BGZ63DRAFT_230523 [Mariannaea sp. PMI_226]
MNDCHWLPFQLPGSSTAETRQKSRLLASSLSLLLLSDYLSLLPDPCRACNRERWMATRSMLEARCTGCCMRASGNDANVSHPPFRFLHGLHLSAAVSLARVSYLEASRPQVPRSSPGRQKPPKNSGTGPGMTGSTPTSNSCPMRPPGTANPKLYQHQRKRKKEKLLHAASSLLGSWLGSNIAI